MKIVLLDGTNHDNIISRHWQDCLSQTDAACAYFTLRNMRILPCRSCGVCGHKTPGECVIKDDMPGVLRAVANCDVIVMLTPVTFGGYSAHLKKAIDRFMVLGEAMYMVKDGHMLHPMRYGRKNLIAVGIHDAPDEQSRDSFETLVDHNALNMQFSALSVFASPSDNDTAIRQCAASMISEVIL